MEWFELYVKFEYRNKLATPYAAGSVVWLFQPLPLLCPKTVNFSRWLSPPSTRLTFSTSNLEEISKCKCRCYISFLLFPSITWVSTKSKSLVIKNKLKLQIAIIFIDLKICVQYISVSIRNYWRQYAIFLLELNSSIEISRSTFSLRTLTSRSTSRSDCSYSSSFPLKKSQSKSIFSTVMNKKNS